MAANQVRDAARLLWEARSAVLATTADGIVHAALVTPALDEDAQPLLLLSSLSTHTAQLRANPACALLVTGSPVTANPQTAPRLCLHARAEPVATGSRRELFLQSHPYACDYIDFGDFGFWKLFILGSKYVGGFANASSLEFAALQHEVFALRDRGYG